MNYIIESLFVGLYTCIIYLIFSPFIKNFSLLLLVCGFFKHILGFIFGIHEWYCNNGDACLQRQKTNNHLNFSASSKYVLRDSINEAFIFVVVGSLLHFLIENELYLFFIMGVILHISSEKNGIHNYFCRQSCIKKN